jgi:hypothetical protein
MLNYRPILSIGDKSWVFRENIPLELVMIAPVNIVAACFKKPSHVTLDLYSTSLTCSSPLKVRRLNALPPLRRPSYSTFLRAGTIKARADWRDKRRRQVRRGLH